MDIVLITELMAEDLVRRSRFLLSEELPPVFSLLDICMLLCGHASGAYENLAGFALSSTPAMMLIRYTTVDELSVDLHIML